MTSMVIYKYHLEDRIEYGISLPKGAKILNVQIQNNWPVVWALVDPNEPVVDRTFIQVWTGREFSIDLDKFDYVGTFTYNTLVYHLFVNKE